MAMASSVQVPGARGAYHAPPDFVPRAQAKRTATATLYRARRVAPLPREESPMPAAALVLLVLPLMQGAASPLPPGARVRVTVREPGRAERQLVGPLRTFDSQALTLATDDAGGHVSLPRPTISRLEIYRGRRGHTVMGLLLGAVLGLSAVAIKDAGCGPDCEKSSGGVVAALVGGGAVVGAGVGTMIRSDRWESLPWAVGPARHAAAPLGVPLVRVSLRF